MNKVKKALKSKKSVAKKSSKSELIGKTSKETEFLVCDGKRISDLLGLVDELDLMSHDVFIYHVNDYRNDFSNWIRDVMKKDELADELIPTRTKEQVQIVILKYIVKKAIR